MPDPLYYSLWFPTFSPIEMLPRALAAMRQFPFSKSKPGVDYLSLHPLSWNETSVLERRYPEGISPEDAIRDAEEFLYEDYAYVFRLHWDLWQPAVSLPGGILPDDANAEDADNDAAANVPGEPSDEWQSRPRPVQLIVHGLQFDDGACEQNGHIQFDLGLDAPFLQEGMGLTPLVESRVRANIQHLVDFTVGLEKHSGANARLLWSESEENLAQKLLTRLQKTQ